MDGRHLAALLLAGAALLPLSACNTDLPTAEEAGAEQQRQDAETRRACQEFEKEILNRTGGKVLEDPRQFKDVFDSLAEEAGAPKEFRDDAKELADKSLNEDPAGFKDAMGKMEAKCREAGYPINQPK